jgi:integrase
LIPSKLPENLWPLLTLLYYTGVRIGEAQKIMWTFDGVPQVDLEKRQITLLGVQTKNGQPRILPLTDELVDTLKKRFQEDGLYSTRRTSARNSMRRRRLQSVRTS